MQLSEGYANPAFWLKMGVNMSTPRISINIVSWNSMEYLPDLLASIFNQTYTDFTVCVIDNASSDDVVHFLKERYPQVTVIRNARNLGFAPAQNQGIKYAIDKWEGEDLSQKFILVTNPDIIFHPNFLNNLMAEVEEHPKVGSFGGKLLRAFGENLTDEVLKKTVCSDLIDSTGLRANRACWFYERGAGEMDAGQFDDQKEVFGISGALVLYRASALNTVRQIDEFFDNDFFAYKEDIDLAWRLQGAGWNARYVPKAIAHHYRGMYGPEKTTWIERLKNRKKKSQTNSHYSTRNHWCLLMKNLSFWHGVVRLPWLVPAELGRFVYVCLFEPKNISSATEAVGLFPRMMKKRHSIFRQRNVRGKEIRKWFGKI